MSTTFAIEYAKSGRASCKGTDCKDHIEKGELRIGASSDNGEYTMTKWYHVKCFKVPRKAKKDIESFVLEMTDNTTDLILSNPERRNEIVETITLNESGKKRKAEDITEPQNADERIAKLKNDFETWKQSAESDVKSKKQSSLTEHEIRQVEAYEAYHSMKNDDLKNVLRWNRQIISGTHPVLLVRVIDGHMYGRLGRCSTCVQGRLRLDDDGSKVHCQGSFDEETKTRHPCFVKMSPIQAPRLSPWYQKTPSAEEDAQMDMEMEGQKISAKSTEAIRDTKASLSEKAATIEWNLSSKDGIKKAATDLLELCKDSDTVIDLPDDAAVARMEVGKVLMENKDKSADQVLELLVDRFGLKQVKEESKVAKVLAIKSSCGHPANAALVAALTELSDLYFKERNTNAGISYSKVVSSLTEIPFEITKDNAMGLGKGKTKLAGIGPSSAEKIYEFVTTGTIQKLEEKRATM